ncbi:MAG: sugar-binding transcriptional regulator [Chloroflexi bacterium]|nr:sugar-binding transcriptional regulator [Chloroflexota bacterium]
MPDLPKDQVATLVQIANMYYKENLSQQEIANQMGVSRSLIANYLQRARDQQVVRIEIADPRDDSAQLALELCRRFGIEKAVLVPYGHKSDELTRRAVAAEAAKFIEARMNDGDVLGIGWGRTTSRMVELLAPTRPLSMDVAPLLGESGHETTYSQMNHLILRTAQRFGGRPHFLLAPMVVGSPALRDMLWGDVVVREVARQWDRMTVACFGVGVLPPTPGMIVYVGDIHAPMLVSKGAVGDICVHPFNQQGEILETPLTDCLIGVGVQQLRMTPCRLAVAAGIEKADAVIGALRTGLITHLIVDAQMATAIIERSGKGDSM